MKRGKAAAVAAAEAAAAEPPTPEEVVAPPGLFNTSNLTGAMATCKNIAGNLTGSLTACGGKVDPLGLAIGVEDAGYERLGADELAVFREESMGDLEGISMIQQDAKVQRVGVAQLGGSFAAKPSEPIAWEPVDPELDIMALIDEEEGISLMQTRVASIHAAPKAAPGVAERRPTEFGAVGPADEGAIAGERSKDDASLDGEAFPDSSGVQEGYSLLQVSAQYKYKQHVS